MPKPKDIARIFMHGRSQAVRLPKQFRMPGDRVRVRRQGRAIVLEPMEPETPEEIRADVQAWFDRLDAIAKGDFLPEGRQQPPMPEDDPLDSFD